MEFELNNYWIVFNPSGSIAIHTLAPTELESIEIFLSYQKLFKDIDEQFYTYWVKEGFSCKEVNVNFQTVRPSKDEISSSKI